MIAILLVARRGFSARRRRTCAKRIFAPPRRWRHAIAFDRERPLPLLIRYFTSPRQRRARHAADFRRARHAFYPIHPYRFAANAIASTRLLRQHGGKDI